MTTPKLELRVERGNAVAQATYIDRFGDRWQLVRSIARCTRCGFLGAPHFTTAKKAGAIGKCCAVLSSRGRIKGPFRPPVDLGPGGRVPRCVRCRRALARKDARAQRMGHTCKDALPKDNQAELPLDDQRTVRLR